MKKRKLSIRARKYIKNKTAGMSDYQAAVKAGYSKNTAIAAKQNIEKPSVQKAIQEIMDKKGLTDEHLVDKTSEGLEAQKIHGTSDNFVEVPDMAVRHKYLETALRLKGYGPHDRIVIDARRQYFVYLPRVLPETTVEAPSKTETGS